MSGEFPVGFLESRVCKDAQQHLPSRPNAACMMNRRFLSFGLFCLGVAGWILFVKALCARCASTIMFFKSSPYRWELRSHFASSFQHLYMPANTLLSSPLAALTHNLHTRERGQCSVQDTHQCSGHNPGSATACSCGQGKSNFAFLRLQFPHVFKSKDIIGQSSLFVNFFFSSTTG